MWYRSPLALLIEAVIVIVIIVVLLRLVGLL